MFSTELEQVSSALDRGTDMAGEVGLERRVIRVAQKARPIDAILWNLKRAIGLLEAENIDYWLVHPESGIRYVIGVRRRQRDEVFNALQLALGSDDTLHLRQIAPRPHAISRFTGTVDSTFEKIQADAQVVRLVRFSGTPDLKRLYGEEYCVEVEFWDDLRSENSRHLFDDELIAPRPGAAVSRMRQSEDSSMSTLAHFTGLQPTFFANSRVRAPASQCAPLTTDVTFPIDVVYTWVDGSDPNWLAAKTKHSPTTDVHAEVNSASRYLSRNELKFSLRSVYDFAPWVRRVFVITDRQRPAWLADSDRVTIVDHTEIFSDSRDLPTFNSHSIESQLHHIEDLSEHFIYFNDDMLLGKPVRPEKFFYSNGIAKHKLSPSRVPFFEGTSQDTPVDRAVKNGRALLKGRFGVEQSQVMEHAPYALRKSVLEFLEAEFPDAVKTTAGNRFRSPSDLNIPSHLAQHTGYRLGKSIPSDAVRFAYVGLHRPDLKQLLDRLAARSDIDAFCLNDTFDPADPVAASDGVSSFLNDYFPIPAPWENEL